MFQDWSGSFSDQSECFRTGPDRSSFNSDDAPLFYSLIRPHEFIILALLSHTLSFFHFELSLHTHPHLLYIEEQEEHVLLEEDDV